MKLIPFSFLAFLFFTSCSNRHYFVIHDVDVFDGEMVVQNVNFVFTKDKIVSLNGKKKHFRNATLIDGSGKTILPPLINAHVHVRNGDNLKEAMQAGIFGVLDMFSTDSRANSLRSFNDSLAFAHFYSSNVGATAPGGHGTQFGVAIPTVNDSISPRQFVRDRLQANADYIKITHEFTMSKRSRIRKGSGSMGLRSHSSTLH